MKRIRVCFIEKLLYTKYKFLKTRILKNNQAEILYSENPRNDKQMDFAIDNKVPFIIYIGESEVKENKLKVKVKLNFLCCLFILL